VHFHKMLYFSPMGACMRKRMNDIGDRETLFWGGGLTESLYQKKNISTVHSRIQSSYNSYKKFVQFLQKD